MVAGTTCFFSPTLAGWNTIQAIRDENGYTNSGTPPSNILSDPGCYQNLRQYVVKQSIGNNANGSGAPAFILQRKRNSTADPIVVVIP